MSRQTNFYAAPPDTDRIHQWLLAEFLGLTLVSQRRMPKECTVPIDASEPGAFWRYPVSCLIPIWAKPLLYVPVVEYDPCHWDEETKTVTRSRFYWAYTGELPAEALRQLNRLFRWVQRNTVPAERTSSRFFPVAAQSARYVREHITDKPKSSPLLQESQLAANNIPDAADIEIQAEIQKAVKADSREGQ